MFLVFNFRCVTILILLNFLKNGTSFYLEEYSWKEYENYIPYDAFVAGTDINGNRLYFGQTLHEGKLISGKIVENKAPMYFEYFSKEYATDENVKILCAQNPNTFKWIPTNANDILRIQNKMKIKGGFEPNVFSYLGRATSNGIINIGKIICMVQECYGLYVSSNTVTQLIKENFEVLTYNDKNDRNGSVVYNVTENCSSITINIYKP